MDSVSIGAAILGGALSFLSPCVLPLVPPYLCFISGASLEDLTREDAARGHRGRIMLAALAFVLGFTTVFVLLGATASYAGQMLRSQLPLLTQLAGLAIIIMGLNFLGLFKLGILGRDTRFRQANAATSLGAAYLVGVAFAFGWTPCIGPVLAGILTFASTAENVGQGMALLAIYSLGLGIPFLLAAFSINAFLNFFKKFRQHLPLVEKLMGALLVLTGIMFLTGSMQTLAYWLIEWFPALARIG